MTQYVYQHYFYLGEGEWPIALSRVRDYDIVSTKVTSDYDLQTGIETITFSHLVKECK